jgi:hypothetical protein
VNPGFGLALGPGTVTRMRLLLNLSVALVLGACATSQPADTTTATVSTPPTTASTTSTVADTTTTSAETSTTVPTTTSSIEVTIPDGWTVYQGTASSMAAPDDWFDAKAFIAGADATVEGLDQSELDALEEYLGAIGPDTLEILDIMLIDRSTLGSGIVTNMNVIVAPVAPITDLVTVDAAITVQIKSFGGTLESSSTEDVNGIEALVVDYTIPTAEGDVAARQYHEIIGEYLYTTTFTGTESQPGTWRRMVETLTPIG